MTFSNFVGFCAFIDVVDDVVKMLLNRDGVSGQLR
jgi:hypothetical protein